MTAACIQAAQAPEPYRVLGRKLKRFTIGHQLLLERFESGYAIGAKTPPTWEDFIFSVWICSQSYAEVLRSLSTRLTYLRIKLWSLRCGHFDVAEAKEFFHRYLDANTAEPEYWVKDRESGGGGGDGEPTFGVVLKFFAQEAFGVSDSQVVDLPFLDVNLLYLRELERRGVIERTSGEDKRLMLAARELEQKVSLN